MLSIEYEAYSLSNGLDVILHRDDALPIVAVNLWYHVGSKDERPGRTGFAHLFEHIMFEGSKHHNRDFFGPLEKLGASINGSTSNDRTNYWTTGPSNALELILWLESDRMGYLLEPLDQERLDLQRDVVKNERRQSYENRPYGKAHLAMETAVYPSPHPYNWPVIGSQEDLNAASLDDVRAFFREYYVPSNASLSVAGSFDPDAARGLIERCFGGIPPGAPIDRVGRMNSTLAGEARLTMRDRVQLPRLSIAWPTPAAFSDAEAPLDILAAILGDGKSSRLHRKLVYETQIARQVSVGQDAREIAGEFAIQVTANDAGQSLEEIEGIVYAELERIASEPPSEREVGRARNAFEADNVQGLERVGGFGGRADQLNYYNVFGGDPGRINSDMERYRAASADDVSRAAREALGGDRVRMVVLPAARAEASTAVAVDRSVMPGVGASPGFRPPTPLRERLPNGLNVLHVEGRRLPTVSVSLVVNGGAAGDPSDAPGLSTLAASMVTEGVATMTSQQIAEEMEYIGSHLHSVAGYEQCALVASTLTEHGDRALEILAEAATGATFPDHELERVRRERLVDLKRIGDDPSAISRRAFRALLFGGGAPYGNPLSGTTASVEAMTRDDIVRKFQSSYRPDGATLIVVGDIAREEALARAAERLGDWAPPNADAATPSAPPASAPPAPPSTTLYLANKPGAAQSVIRAGCLTIEQGHEDRHALNLLSYLFGGNFMGRLNQNLRQDKGYSYGFHSSVDWCKGPSMFSASGSVQTSVTKESVMEVLREFGDIRAGRPVGDEEFEEARGGLLKGFPGEFETQAHLLSQLAHIERFGLPDDYYAGLQARYEAVTPSDVRRVAVERIDSERLTLLVVGDRTVIEPGLVELGLPIVHVDNEGAALD